MTAASIARASRNFEHAFDVAKQDDAVAERTLKMLQRSNAREWVRDHVLPVLVKAETVEEAKMQLAIEGVTIHDDPYLFVKWLFSVVSNATQKNCSPDHVILAYAKLANSEIRDLAHRWCHILMMYIDANAEKLIPKDKVKAWLQTYISQQALWNYDTRTNEEQLSRKEWKVRRKKRMHRSFMNKFDELLLLSYIQHNGLQVL